MGNYLGVPLLVLAAALQATFMPQIRILGGEPDLIFLLVVGWSLNGRLEESIVWAFVGGILRDLLSAAPTGATTLSLIVIVFLVDAVRGQVSQIGFLLRLVLIVVGTLLHQAVQAVLLVASGFAVDPVSHLAYVILPTLAYNLVFSFPAYALIRRMQRAGRIQRSTPRF